ncbi:ATP-binding protein [Tepidibacter mesophilus]|uniref:ATP-binding protein n=1 Tax=Tepidibacter mesophilus TaxID=655607 RepID=UPI000C081F69|nr:ATP-binding protein [Tepidibacter mesophilus]
MKKGIKFKLLIIFVLIFILIVMNSIWSIMNFDRLSNSIDDIMQANYKSVVAAQNMIVSLERQDSAELTYMFTTDKKAENIFLENQQSFFKWFSRAEDNITEEGEEATLDKINTLYTSYINKFSILIQINNNKGPKESRIYYYNEILPNFESLKNECRNLQNLNQEAMLDRKNTAHNVAQKATYSTLIISIITIIVGLSLAFYFANKIVSPIYELIIKTKKIAQGDYSKQLDISGNDEIAELSQEFNSMTEKLKYYEQLNVLKLMKEKQKSDAIVESINDGIIVTDEENRILLVNKAAEKALDIREKDALNRHFLEVIKEESIFEIINKSKNNSDIQYYKTYFDTTIKTTEKSKHYRINVEPIISKNEEHIGMVTLMQDITNLKEVDQMKSDFISTVSHEFRTPLTSIIMASGILLDEIAGYINEDQKELLRAIKEDGDRLKNLVSDLLDLSKIESGKIDMDFQVCNIKSILEYAVKPFDITARNKNITLKIEVEDNLNKVKADFNKISWVLTNLIGNALRYTSRDGNGKIEINAKETGNKILVSVQDNGKGIPEEYQQKIFEKFIQVKNEDDEIKGSTGLGLAISKEIINAHGGDIWVKSKLREGSVFYFTLNLERQ